MYFIKVKQSWVILVVIEIIIIFRSYCEKKRQINLGVLDNRITTEITLHTKHGTCYQTYENYLITKDYNNIYKIQILRRNIYIALYNYVFLPVICED